MPTQARLVGSSEKRIWVNCQDELFRPSNIPWANPQHMVPKKDKTWWLCWDCRRLNVITAPDRYQIRHIQDIVSELKHKRVYYKLDLHRGLHQIPIMEADVPKTATATPFGLHEFTVMASNLRNTAQTFQRAGWSAVCMPQRRYPGRIKVPRTAHRRLGYCDSYLTDYGLVVNISNSVF